MILCCLHLFTQFVHSLCHTICGEAESSIKVVYLYMSHYIHYPPVYLKKLFFGSFCFSYLALQLRSLYNSSNVSERRWKL